MELGSVPALDSGRMLLSTSATCGRASVLDFTGAYVHVDQRPPAADDRYTAWKKRTSAIVASLPDIGERLISARL